MKIRQAKKIVNDYSRGDMWVRNRHQIGSYDRAVLRKRKWLWQDREFQQRQIATLTKVLERMRLVLQDITADEMSNKSVNHCNSFPT